MSWIFGTKGGGAGGGAPIGTPSGPAPDIVEDFSLYTNTADLIAFGANSGNVKNIWTNLQQYCHNGCPNDDGAGSTINLDTSVAYPGYTQSMRYDWAPYAGNSIEPVMTLGTFCFSPQLNNFGGVNGTYKTVVEMWTEIFFKFSNGYATPNSNNSNCVSSVTPAYKFVFWNINTSAGQGRYGMEVGVYGNDGYGGSTGTFDPEVPFMIDDFNDNNISPPGIFDGTWHRLRTHHRCGTAAQALWIAQLDESEYISTFNGNYAGSSFASPWQANTNYSNGQYIWDSNNNLQKCIQTGVSGGSAPSWSTGGGNHTNDNSIVWSCMNSSGSPATNVWSIWPGNNLNCGAKVAQSLWWQKIAVWMSVADGGVGDPGWGL